MKVVGVDPGTHTGCVVWTDEGRKGPKAQYGQVLESHEFTGTEEDHARWSLGNVGPYLASDWRSREVLCAMNVYGLCLEVQPELIVIEDFVLRGGRQHSSARAGLSPDRVQAIIHALLLVDAGGEAADRVLLNGQVLWLTASMAKTTITDERLKHMGLWIPGKRHARDALRHAITGYRKVRG